MSFAAFTSALVVRQGPGTDWQSFRVPPILFINTVILLASSGTLMLCRSRLAGDPRAVRWLWATLALGLGFVVGQVFAWRGLAAQGLFLATNPSSSFFYVLTVLHALHVVGGLTGLTYTLWRLSRATGPAPWGVLRAASIYWHFMGALWLYVLLILTVRL